MSTSPYRRQKNDRANSFSYTHTHTHTHTQISGSEAGERKMQNSPHCSQADWAEPAGPTIDRPGVKICLLQQQHKFAPQKMEKKSWVSPAKQCKCVSELLLHGHVGQCVRLCTHNVRCSLSALKHNTTTVPYIQCTKEEKTLSDAANWQDRSSRRLDETETSQGCWDTNVAQSSAGSRRTLRIDR